MEAYPSPTLILHPIIHFQRTRSALHKWRPLRRFCRSAAHSQPPRGPQCAQTLSSKDIRFEVSIIYICNWCNCIWEEHGDFSGIASYIILSQGLRLGVSRSRKKTSPVPSGFSPSGSNCVSRRVFLECIKTSHNLQSPSQIWDPWWLTKTSTTTTDTATTTTTTEATINNNKAKSKANQHQLQ